MANLSPTQQAFIDRYAPYANLASQQTGLPSRVILAKIALETGYGTRFANNNLPGLQSGNAGQNEGSIGSRSTATWEDRGNGSTYNTNANFLRYRSPEESIGGLVNWLNNSGLPQMNTLADRQGGGIFDRDANAEASAVAALGRSGFSTDTNASNGLNTILGLLPDLGRYGVASSFDPSLNRLAQLSPYQAGGTDVSLGAGDITSNNYWSRRGWDDSRGNASETTEYQPRGELLPGERNGSGISLPGPTISTSPQQLGTLDQISDALTGSLRAGANLIGNRLTDALGRLPTADELRQRVDALTSGSRSLADQLADISVSDEARAYGDRTGFDPRQYAINDAYVLGTGRGATADDLSHSMDLLRGGTSFGDLARGITGSQEGQVYQLGQFYRGAFDRDIDSPGLQNALNAIRSGQSLQSVETSLLQSPEAQTLGLSTQEQLARLLTPNLYGAPILNTGTETGTLGGTGTNTGTLNTGTTTHTLGGGTETGTIGGGGTETITQGPRSAERQALIDTLSGQFQRATGRGVDAETVGSWDADLTAGTPMELLEARTLGAPETITAQTGDLADLNRGYQERYGLTAQDVLALGPMAGEFRDVLGRGPDAATLRAWDAQIDAGTPMSILEAGLLGSQEARTRGPEHTASLINDYETRYGFSPDEALTLAPIASQYTTLLGRPVDAETIRSWTDQLTAGNGMPTLEAGLLQAPEVLARTGGHGDLYDTFASQNGGRTADAYLRGLTDPTGFSGQNSGGGTGAGTFTGTFDPAAYLRANPDVANSGLDPMQHFLRYGFNEGRAIDPSGHAVARNFDPTAYLQQNPDVAAAHLDPLQHWLTSGAHEGRALPTGNNPYAFSNFNLGAGAQTGSFGLNGVVTGGGANGGGTAGGTSTTTTGGSTGGGVGSYDFSRLNAGTLNTNFGQNGSTGTGLPGTIGGLPSFAGNNVFDPSQNVGLGSFGLGGIQYNPLGGGDASTVNGGSIYGDGQAIADRNSQLGEAAYLAGQQAQNEAYRTAPGTFDQRWVAGNLNGHNDAIVQTLGGMTPITPTFTVVNHNTSGQFTPLSGFGTAGWIG